ncbi:hypothetical protein Ahy_A02g007379 [Arachis hypogaea]|uniref:Aminotransferase-like plant mobile domain-containing protein n=1 Tax=Arachis hypogaea TaxID=3818 RepID=A0A445EC74_ARAHY|nr:hypothetical protein Ahy_A02g007379 [Arachis hypogaea]
MARQVGNNADINRLNETSHCAGVADFERPRFLLPWRVSHTLPPPDAIVPYLVEAGFGDIVPLRDFTFDNSLISALVEQWRPETHTFHLPWGEVTITLQDVAYHLGLRAQGNPVGWCLRDFVRWYGTETWAMVEELLGTRSPVAVQQATQRKESFTLKLRSVKDIAGCTPLLMSWIYQRFPQWCLPDRGIYQYPLAASLHGESMMTLRCRIYARTGSVRRRSGFNGEQPVLGTPVNLDRYLTTTGRGEDV